MEISVTHDVHGWDEFIVSQPWRPFLQSWTMGEVYDDIGQKPVRITAHEGSAIHGICFGHIVPARRGKHISVPYGPLIDESCSQAEVAHITERMVQALKREAKRLGCTFIRFSPFWPQGRHSQALSALGSVSSPLHLHDETRKRHGFTAYTNAFFESQVMRFSKRKECTLYLAKYQGKTIAASIHMHAFGETSYHHGASSSEFQKIPASYLLQWTAIRDAMKRGDRIYNFWGIAPLDESGNVAGVLGKHPFGGVTLFKTGFGGHILNLVHCKDAPVTSAYWLTYAFEKYRKWKRGF